jgi:hypothetical protein
VSRLTSLRVGHSFILTATVTPLQRAACKWRSEEAFAILDATL